MCDVHATAGGICGDFGRICTDFGKIDLDSISVKVGHIRPTLGQHQPYLAGHRGNLAWFGVTLRELSQFGRLGPTPVNIALNFAEFGNFGRNQANFLRFRASRLRPNLPQGLRSPNKFGRIQASTCTLFEIIPNLAELRPASPQFRHAQLARSGTNLAPADVTQLLRDSS